MSEGRSFTRYGERSIDSVAVAKPPLQPRSRLNLCRFGGVLAVQGLAAASGVVDELRERYSPASPEDS
jgi:hypothetical protein